ncbi:right-handed parallel beta-helix repeat-containing protein [uncultured Methylibium sp.]|uniref:right-handed parallel beta-helix repeat-containing protein n=1 Tax=uncultured Methylibium sp. TaxID=381093 RepID=UPI0025D57854|nr:right-handed parallel beta-helix repeat-containing protein [uncultured Methylibium sp.]
MIGMPVFGRTTRPLRLRHGLLWALTLGLAGLAGCANLASARSYHFSDCQEGAAPGCVPGSNGNPGTAAAPKRDLSAIDVNSLAPGSQLLFRRGGSWNHRMLELENDYVTPTAPLVFDAYGEGPLPLLRTARANAFLVGGRWANTSNDGGYTFRNLKLDGLGTADWGIWLVHNVRNVTVENVEITGFHIAIHASGGGPHGIHHVIVRNSTIRRNGSMGFLGTINDSVFEGNLFEANNFSGSNRNHAIYQSGGNNNTFRNNKLIRNSVANGTCTGGNFTVHGQVDRLLIEGNLIEQDAAAGGCYGFSVTTGYDSNEWFRNVVVRGNTVVNVGYCAVCANAAPGIVIEGNRLINTASTYQVSVQIPTSKRSPGDDEDARAVVRNNVICHAAPASGSTDVRVAGDGAQVSGNVYRRDRDATTGPCAR